MATSARRFDREARIAAALDDVDLTTLDLWNDLDALATHVEIEGVDVPPEGVEIMPDGRFSAVMNLYVVLRYDNNEDDGFSMGESFLAHVSGRLNDDVPEVEHSSVDTSAFD